MGPLWLKVSITLSKQQSRTQGQTKHHLLTNLLEHYGIWYDSWTPILRYASLSGVCVKIQFPRKKICINGRSYLTQSAPCVSKPWKRYNICFPVWIDKNYPGWARINIDTSPQYITRIDKYVFEVVTGEPTIPTRELLASILCLIWKAMKSFVFQASKLIPLSIWMKPSWWTEVSTFGLQM